MTRYAKPIDLERLQAHLHAAGFRSSILTVKHGVQQLEVHIDRKVVVVDQAGNATGEPDLAPLETAIAGFRNA